MNRCTATIRSPWRFGATTTCQLPEDHDGLHTFKTAGAQTEVEVHWLGQDDKATADRRFYLDRLHSRR